MINTTIPKTLSVKEAAHVLEISTMGIRMAMIAGKLKHTKDKKTGRISIKLEDLKSYHENRYNKSCHFDEDECSVKQAAKFLDVTEQFIYYRLRTRELPFHRKSKGIIAIKKEDVKKFLFEQEKDGDKMTPPTQGKTNIKTRNV